ncbi:MAG: iron ABC transporter permease [Gammaproteobacteria bacterium]|nr:iron ABC transporter permease [Gammaproteobacteria bacterium]
MNRATLTIYTLTALILISIAAFTLALAVGSVNLEFSETVKTLAGEGSRLHKMLVLELRLPRAIAAFATGGLLALAGALMQVLLRNPLADPYILGVSGGAAIGALLPLMLGAAGIWMNGGALAGALLSTLLVFTLAHGRGDWTPTRLLLTGVVIASGWAAVISLMLALSTDSNLRSMLFWLMGDLSYVRDYGGAVAILVLGLLVVLPFGRQLNLLARGELQARILGVSVKPLRIGIYLTASLFTAVAVTQGGSIGFVGLVVPHMLRLIIGADHRLLLPGAVLLGGTLLLLADTLARTIVAPRQLPVGVVTAAIGVPLFLYLLTRSRSQI